MPKVSIERHGPTAVLTIDNPPVNGLGAAVRQGLGAALDEALDDAAVEVIVIRGAGSMFSGGADIREFNTLAARAEPSLPQLCNRIELAGKPIVAAVHGTAAGGGLELPLACHYRIAASGTRLGLPEVRLGIVPGAGGTQRLPRVAGVSAALDIIVSGDLIAAGDALKLGVVDRLSTGDLLSDALAFAAEVKGRGPRPSRTCERHLEEARAKPAVFDDYRKKIATRSRGVEAPFACIDCIEASITRPFEEGLAFERSTFLRCVESEQSKAQRHAFFAERAAAKVADLPAGTPVREIRTAAVIGCGTMGGGIAMNFANAGIPVHVLESDPAALARGLDIIRQNYESSASRGRLSPEDAKRRLGLITGTTVMGDLAQADIVIEAVFEDMDLKREVFRKLDEAAKPDAILATNTSTLDVDEIAAATRKPERVMGTHFFSPANVMRLLENVRGRKTSPEVIATVMALSKRIGKIPVLARVCDGFVGNRMLDHYFRQAGLLLEEGALPHEVDKAMYDFGFPMGPFAMSDLAGLDVGWRVRKERLKRKPDTPRYSPVGDRLCELGRFGQKTGQGWYRYEPGSRTPQPDPAVEKIILDTSRELGIERRKIEEDEILERCLYPMINEAAKILEEGIAQRASDVDVVWLYGYGFPRHRGGPLFYADTVGPARVLDTIRRLHARIGAGLEPAPLLVELAESGRKFSDLPDPYRP